MILNSVTDAIGRTPLVRLQRIGKETGAEILVKLEKVNPAGSIKDRIALKMVEEAEKQGVLKPDSIIVEATSGNTGIGLSMVGAARGYKTVIFMPEDASRERQMLVKAYGAEVRLTPAIKSTAGAFEAAEDYAKREKRVFLTNQFDNLANPKAHEETGREIAKDTRGRLDAFVAGVGTGGTLQGVSKILKKEAPDALMVGVEPASCNVIDAGSFLSDRAEMGVLANRNLSNAILGESAVWGKHKIAGIGPNYLSKVLDRKVVDRIIKVTDDDAYAMTRELARKEGILAGVSSGANVWAALQIAKELGKGSRIVTVAPDGGERYLSTAGLFDSP